jgi:hypothetical protein
MSSLWHDPDFEPIRQFHAPVVTRNFDDLPVPTEHHELPEGVDDPFAKLEAVYDVASAQMDRGLKGSAFLHGKPLVASATSAVRDLDNVVTQVRRPVEQPADPARVQQHTQARATHEQHRRRDEVAAVRVPQPSSSSSSSSSSSDASRGPDAAVFVPMAAGSIVAAAVPGPLAMTSPLQQVATAASAVAEVAVGGAVHVDDVGDVDDAALDAELDAELPRLGLSRRR